MTAKGEYLGQVLAETELKMQAEMFCMAWLLLCSVEQDLERSLSITGTVSKHPRSVASACSNGCPFAQGESFHKAAYKPCTLLKMSCHCSPARPQSSTLPVQHVKILHIWLGMWGWFKWGGRSRQSTANTQVSLVPAGLCAAFNPQDSSTCLWKTTGLPRMF